MIYPNVNEQTIRVNIFDADTKELIQKDFSTYRGEQQGGVILYQTFIHAGSGDIVTTRGSLNFSLVAEQVASYGYDINSLTGDDIAPIPDAAGIPFYPWVVNMYLRKLA